MSSDEKNDQRKDTFTGRARRKQLIEATIEAAATRGFLHTTLAEIAQIADISPGVIPYYFGSKDELVEETLNALYERADSYIATRVTRQETAWAKLRAYVEAQIEYAETHRQATIADWELLTTFDSPERKRQFNKSMYNPIRQQMQAIVEQGVASGEFREVPVRPAASVILATLDGIILQWTWDKDAVDLDACRDVILELIESFLCKPSADP